VVADDAAWSAALAGRFYREEFADRPVFLCVDEETLAVLAQDEGIVSGGTADGEAGQAAARALARSVRSRVRASEPLAAWTQDAVAWRRSGYAGPPPFLALLAVTVLAATTIGGRSDRGYYSRLNDLLGLPGRGMPRYFDSDIQQLWRCLNEWLTDVEHGRRGRPTATNLTSAQSNIGWALSQTVLRPADRARLPLLFTTLGLYPGQRVDGQLLVAGLRRTGLAGHGLSRRLTQVLEDPSLTESLATTLASELAGWDGGLRDESGRCAVQLLLTYHQRSRTFGVAVRTPPDLAGHSIRAGDSAAVPLGQAGELQPLTVPVTAGLLDGASLPAQLLPPDRQSGAIAELRLVMTHSDLRVLTPSDALARWVEVRPAERHRRHLVVVRSELAQAAVAVMGPLTQDPPRRTSVPCPHGWVGYEYEPVRAAAAGTVAGPLAVLSPRGGEIAALDGGLAVSARSRLYLAAGPPDVLFDLSDGDGAVEVDGQPVFDVGSAGRLRLAGRGLAEGTHEVNVGGARLTLRLVNEHALGPMAGTLGTRLQAGTTPTGRPWTVPLPPVAGDGQDGPGAGADVVVHGASVERSAGADALAHPVTALAARARAGGRHYALGPRGTAARIHPQPPAWLLALAPQPVPHLVDLAGSADGLPFTPRWFLRIAQDRASAIPADARRNTPATDEAPDVAGAVKTTNVWDEVLPWLADAATAPGQADAWATWLASTAPTDSSSPNGASPGTTSPDIVTPAAREAS
jgi:hypothetical protein